MFRLSSIRVHLQDRLGSTALQSRPPFPQIVLLSSWMGGSSLQKMLCLMHFLNLANQKTYYMSTCYLCSEPNFLSGEQRSPLTHGHHPSFSTPSHPIAISYIRYQKRLGVVTLSPLNLHMESYDTRLDDRQIYLCQGHFLNLEGVLLLLRTPKPPVG